jgi:dihydropteroate synthase
VDPGIGFGKTPAENWALIAASQQIAALGYPVVWGASRKRFLAGAYATPTDPWERDAAGVALTALLGAQRVWAVRVHTVAEHRTAIAVAELVRQAATEVT